MKNNEPIAQPGLEHRSYMIATQKLVASITEKLKKSETKSKRGGGPRFKSE